MIHRMHSKFTPLWNTSLITDKEPELLNISDFIRDINILKNFNFMIGPLFISIKFVSKIVYISMILAKPLIILRIVEIQWELFRIC